MIDDQSGKSFCVAMGRGEAERVMVPRTVRGFELGPRDLETAEFAQAEDQPAVFKVGDGHLSVGSLISSLQLHSHQPVQDLGATASGTTRLQGSRPSYLALPKSPVTRKHSRFSMLDVAVCWKEHSSHEHSPCFPV